MCVSGGGIDNLVDESLVPGFCPLFRSAAALDSCSRPKAVASLVADEFASSSPPVPSSAILTLSAAAVDDTPRAAARAPFLAESTSAAPDEGAAEGTEVGDTPAEANASAAGIRDCETPAVVSRAPSAASALSDSCSAVSAICAFQKDLQEDYLASLGAQKLLLRLPIMMIH